MESFYRLYGTIDLLAILQKSLDRVLFLYNFIREVRSSGVRASIITDLLAILQKRLDRALFLYNFIREVRSSGVRIGSITIMHVRNFFKLRHNIVRFRFFPRIAKRSIVFFLHCCIEICFSLESETLSGSIKQVVADLWSRKVKQKGCFRTSLLLFSTNVQIK